MQLTLHTFCFLLLLSFFAHSQNTCRDKLDLVQTGSVTAYAPGFPDSNRERIFTVQVSGFTVPASGFQIAASLEASLFSAFSANGYDFSVRAFRGQNSTQAKIALLINNDNSWTSMKISYLITARSDLQAGFFIADSYAASENSQSTSQVITFTHSLPGWSTRTNSVSTAVQLAGLRTSSSSIRNIEITAASIDPRNGILSVNVTLGSTGYVEFLYFSYVWWVNSPLFFTAFFDPANASAVDHQLTGVTQISNNRLIYKAVSFSGPVIPGSIPCSGSGCTLRCVQIVQCVSANGIIANNVCYLCGVGQYYQNFACQNITCPPNMKLMGSQCVCPVNFYLTAPSVCSQCPLNSRWESNQCVCNDGFYMQKTLCVGCPAFSTFDNKSRSCQCNQGYSWFENSCIKCGDNQTWDLQTNSCICSDGYERVNNACIEKCTLNAKRINSICVCNSGLRNASGLCLPCPPQSVLIPSQNTCLCGLGLFFFNNSCISCGKNEAWNSIKNECECIKDFNKVDSVCQQCSNSSWNGSQCVCNAGFERINSTSCIQCDALKSWNGTTCSCKETFVSFGSVCFCPLGSKFIDDRCVCNNGQPPVNQSCQTAISNLIVAIKCGINEQQLNGTCICKLNHIRINSTCTACPEKSASDGNKCICITGLYMINNSCVECDKRARYNETDMMCYCRDGFFGNYSQCKKCHNRCQTCDGPKANDCLTCAEGQTLQKGTCVKAKAQQKSDSKDPKEEKQNNTNAQKNRRRV